MLLAKSILSNAHKWFFCTKGTSVFYVRKQYQKDIAPTVVGCEWTKDSFVGSFEFPGTRD